MDRFVQWMCCASIALGAASSTNAADVDPMKLPGIVVDDAQAELPGTWTASTKVVPFVGAGYRYCGGGEDQRATFKIKIPTAGKYQALLAYTASGNRSEEVPVILQTADGEKTVLVNQRNKPQLALLFEPLGEFNFAAGETTIVISAAGAKPGPVIVDAVQLLTAEQFAEAKKNQPAPAPMLAVTAPVAKPMKVEPKKEAKPEAVIEKAPAFTRIAPTKARKKLTSEELDQILHKQVGGILDAPPCDDESFLRRVCFDLIGRQPRPEEAAAFAADPSSDKRAALVERLLASPEFGVNWANYWSDVVSYRTPQPELTFLNYGPFKAWLANEWNRGAKWDEIVYRVVTAGGKVGENPEATFVGFHQADKSRLASETTRVFLSTQIQCAECHDHKFIDLRQETFHHVAAYFARVDAKLPHNDSNLIVVSSKAKGEHAMPEKKGEMMSAQAFGAAPVEVGASDIARRTELAEWLTSPENPWFAKAFVNRVWARLLGRGFSEPVDEIGELGDHVLPETFDTVADHFVATQYDPKDVFRLITLSRTYQRTLEESPKGYIKPFSKISPGRLRGDEVFETLAVGLELPNITPPAMKPSEGVRFPPPPKSTRDLVNETFGFDPSLAAENVGRTMQQAMFLMNNRQVQKQVDAKAESGTLLAKLLAETADDNRVLVQLYERLLARKPTEREIEIAKKHLLTMNDRQAAFEDLLWSMLNSAEFTSRR